MQSSVHKGGFPTCTACVNSRVTQTCLQTTVPPGKAFRLLYAQRASQKHNSELNSAVKSEQDLEIAVPQQHSSAPATSAQLLCTANITAQHPAGRSPPTACTTQHSCQGRSRQELCNGTRFAKKSIVCLPPQEGASLLQERCLTKEHLWHQVRLLKHSLHMLYS